MPLIRRIVPCLWFDGQAEQAARFYTSIFRNSRLGLIARYGEFAREVGQQPGSLMTVQFEIDGQPFTALNGGPEFKFTEAISLQIECRDQAEIDYYWDNLGAGGDPRAQQCGWLKDKFGVSWQVVPEQLAVMVADPDHAKSERVMQALMKMKKLDVATLQRAYAGQASAA